MAATRAVAHSTLTDAGVQPAGMHGALAVTDFTCHALDCHPRTPTNFFTVNAINLQLLDGRVRPQRIGFRFGRPMSQRLATREQLEVQGAISVVDELKGHFGGGNTVGRARQQHEGKYERDAD